MLGSVNHSRRDRASANKGNGGWVHIEKEQHWCFPPRWYPQPERGESQVGPGSQWECSVCCLVWTSYGIFLDNDADNWPRGDMSIRPLFGVARWRIADRNEQVPRSRFRTEDAYRLCLENIRNQEDSYDWRGINTLNNKFLRRIIELMPGGSEDVWRNSMD